MKKLIQGSAAFIATCWRVDRRRLTVSIALMILNAASLPLVAAFSAEFTDAAVAGSAGAATWWGVGVALGILAALTAAHFAHIFYFELSEAATLKLSNEVNRLANDSDGIEHLERPEYHDKLQLLRTEVVRSGRDVLESWLHMVGLGVSMTLTALLLVRLDPWLLLLPLAALGPLGLGARAEAQLHRARSDSASDLRVARHFFRLGISVEAAKELRVNNQQRDIRKRQLRAWQQGSATVLRYERRAALLRVLGQLIFAGGYIGATLLVISNTVRGRGTVGDVVLIITLAAQVNGQVVAAVALLQSLQRGAAMMVTLKWLKDLVNPRPTVVADQGAPARLTEGIELRDLSFTYPGTDRPILQNVNLSIPAGTTVAVVGENGAGKTSLVKLLCRFYEPTSGQLLVDGVDLRRIELAGWRARIAAGFQDFVRFQFSARQAIGVGDLPKIDDDAAVLSAIDRAQAGAIMQRLPEGLDTKLGLSQDGTDLSGGQWQRLALSRAMMRTDPLLLVLDEPTSALDAQAEHDLFERYVEQAKDVGERTGAITVLVSHRFSTVRMADLIVVISDGTVSEVGTHEELMAVPAGLYAELFSLQAQQYQ